MDQKQTQKLPFELPQDLMFNQIQANNMIKKAHNNSIESMAAHPSHKSFASGSHDKTIKLWDLGKIAPNVTLTDHKEGVWSLDFSNDGKNLISASPDRNVLVWDTKKSSPVQRLIGHKDKVYSAKINENDKLIASIGEGAELLIWDVAKVNEPIKRVNLQSFVGFDLSWSNNGQFLFATTIGGKTIALETKNFNIVDVATENVSPQTKMEGIAVNWKTLPNKVFSACEEGLIIWYEFAQRKLKRKIEFVGHVGTGCRNVNLHPHQKYMLSSGKDGSVRLWDCHSQGRPKIQANLIAHDENVTSPIFVGDEVIVTGSWDQSIGIWKFGDLIAQK